MDIPSDENIQHAYTVTTPNASVPSTLPAILCTPPVAQYKEPEALPDMPQLQVQETGNVPTAALSLSSRRLDGACTSTKPQHSCNICRKTYAQSQGVRRHQRETHKGSVMPALPLTTELRFSRLFSIA